MTPISTESSYIKTVLSAAFEETLEVGFSTKWPTVICATVVIILSWMLIKGTMGGGVLKQEASTYIYFTLIPVVFVFFSLFFAHLLIIVPARLFREEQARASAALTAERARASEELTAERARASEELTAERARASEELTAERAQASALLKTEKARADDIQRQLTALWDDVQKKFPEFDMIGGNVLTHGTPDPAAPLATPLLGFSFNYKNVGEHPAGKILIIIHVFPQTLDAPPYDMEIESSVMPDSVVVPDVIMGARTLFKNNPPSLGSAPPLYAVVWIRFQDMKTSKIGLHEVMMRWKRPGVVVLSPNMIAVTAPDEIQHINDYLKSRGLEKPKPTK